MGHGHGKYVGRTDNSNGVLKPKKAKKDSDITVAEINYPIEPRIKYVKKARMWCKTWFDNPRRKYGQMMQTQHQEWLTAPPKGKK